MSISNQNQKVSRSGDGTSHQFSFDFRIAQAADLVVIVRNDTTGVAVTKTLDTHYIIPTSSVNAASGGNILFKFNTGTSSDAHYSTTDQRPQNGETIIIKRVVQLTQGVDLQAADSLPADTLEDAYDKLTFGLQQVQEQLGRALLRPATDSTSATLPDNIDLKGKVLQFNSSTGVPEAVAGLTDTATSTTPGLMSTADKSKLDGIEAGATGDQNAAEIRTLVESATDSNVFTDADHSKLNSIESSATADQTDSEIKTAYENNADTNALTDTLLAKLNNIEANATADQTDSEIKTAYENNANTNAFTDADHSKLDAIEASATADQDASEIRALVESATDSNVFTDADHSKLNAIEAGATADQTASDIRGLGFFDTSNDGTGSGLDADKLDGQEGTYYQAASTALTTSTSFGGDVSGAYNAIVIADDSHNHVIGNVDGLQDALNAKAPLASPGLTGTPTAPTAAADTSTTQIATTAFVQQELAELIDSAPSTLDTLNEIAAAINDDPNFNTTVTTSLSNRLRIDVNNQSLTETQKSNATTNLGLSAVAVSGAYSDISGTPSAATTSAAGLMSAADKTKIDGIESNATADQTASEIKTLYENNSNTNALTDALLSKLNAIEASATADQTASEIRTLVESANDSNVFTNADHSKLNAIEADATADQTAAEIRTLVESATDSNVFTDADHSKLNAIEASATADQTAAEIRALVESATDSNVFTDNDHSKLNAIEAGATADQTAADIRGLGFFDTSNDGASSGLDSDLLDGQHGSHYLDYNNFTNVPTLTTTLSALTDTTISTVGDNDLIAYDSGSSKFINQTAAEAGFATVATSGAYSDLSGTPTIPSSTSDLTNDSGFITSVPAQSFSSLTGKPTTIAGYGITDAFDGAYGSLTGAPTIPSNTNQLTNGAGFITSTVTGTFTTDAIRFGDSHVKRISVDYTGGSDYLVDNEYQKILTITPTNNSRNYSIIGRIMATSGSAVHTLDINIALRTNTLPDLDFSGTYTSTITGTTEYLTPRMWVKETTTAGFELVIEVNAQIYGRLNADLEIITREEADLATVVVNTNEDSEVTSVTTGFTQYNLTKVFETDDGVFALTNGVLDLKNTGSQSELRLYCESSNAHYAALKAPAHADFSGDVDLTLPATTSTILSTTSNLNDLANVSVGSPSNGQVLKYVSAVSRWEASDESGGSSSGNGFFSIEGERSGSVATNQIFAIGNGASPTNGQRIPIGCTLKYITVATEESSTLEVEVYVNGSASGHKVSCSSAVSAQSSELNVSISAGSMITLKCVSGSSAKTTVAAAYFSVGITNTNADTVDSKHISVVSSLPSSPDSNTIYFVTS